MHEPSIPVWTLDRDTHTLVVGSRRIDLTPLEGQAVAYLEDRAGTVVTRRALERDVWGIAEGVTSQTTAVTIRNIRRKIGPAGKQMIETVFGVGWKLHDPRQHASAPRFPTPFFPREQELSALRQLFDDGWRIITLTGPGGAGKTRLSVALLESLDIPLVFVGLSTARDDADVERALLSAAGMSGGTMEALRMAVAGRDLVFLLDEAEDVVPSVVRVLPHLSGHRVLVTSRLPLSADGEAVHRVRPLLGEEGAAFFSRQLRASRWNHSIAPDQIAPILEWVDGSPLALELIAADPTPPAKLLEKLQRGDLPGPAMEIALDQSYRRLASGPRETLHALSLCDAVVDETLVADWLGDDAVANLHTLVEHSLLHREAEGWRLLRTMRSFVRSQPVDWAPHQRAFDAWLVRHCRDAEPRIFREPTAALDSLTPLVDDLLAAVPRLDEAGIVDLLWALYLYSYMRGPLTIQTTAVKLARAHAPESAMTSILAAYSGMDVDTEQLVREMRRARPRDQIRALVVFSISWLPHELTWISGFVADLVPDPDDELGLLYLRRLMLIFQPDPVAAAQQLMEDGADYPLLGWMTQHTVARIHSIRGDAVRACRNWERMIADVADQRQTGTLLFAVYGYADALTTLDRGRATAVFHEAAELGITEGFGNTWAVGRAGFWLALLGDHEAALEFLVHGARGDHESTRVACEAMILALRALQGDHAAREHVRAFDRSTIVGVLGDGTVLAELVDAWVQHGLGEPVTPPSFPTLAWRVWETTRSTASD